MWSHERYYCFFVCNTDPYEDQFEKQSVDRKERISKNEYQRLQNIAKSQKGGRIKGTCQDMYPCEPLPSIPTTVSTVYIIIIMLFLDSFIASWWFKEAEQTPDHSSFGNG